MTQIGEKIALLVLEENRENCWFCREPPRDEQHTTDLGEDPAGPQENDLANDSSRLGRALGHRPTWTIRVPGVDQPVNVVPAAHHLIPGNASLKQVPKLVQWLKKGSKIREDVGYDVNARENGIWLPGSYGVTEQSALQTKWSAYDYQNEYAIAAMKAAGRSFTMPTQATAASSRRP
ncbi:MAG: hypothetical protein ACRET3_08860 [Burkholderiales bacterium]